LADQKHVSTAVVQCAIHSAFLIFEYAHIHDSGDYFFGGFKRVSLHHTQKDQQAVTDLADLLALNPH